MDRQSRSAVRESDSSDDDVARLRGQLRATQLMVAIVSVLVIVEFFSPFGIPKRSATYSSSKGGKLIASAEDDAAGLTIRSPDGTLRDLLVANKGSDAALILYDPGGKPRAEVSVQTAGPGIRLRDASGRVRIELDLDGGEPRISLFDERGVKSWSAP